jgi:hypothetical protein
MVAGIAVVGADPVGATTASQAAYIDAIAAPAQRVQAASRIPASVTIAQSALESAWGTSRLTVNDSNYFGFKCVSASDPGPIAIACHNYPTQECTPGCHTVNAYFRVYRNAEDSLRDYARLLTTSDRYAPAFQYTDDPDEFIRQIHRGGYATDPDYASKVISIMREHNLYRFNSGPPAPVPPVAVAGRPSVEFAGALHVFLFSATGHLYQQSYQPGAGWQTRNLGGEFDGTPVAVQWGDSLNVFAMSRTRHLYQVSYRAGAGWSMTDHGGQYASNPAVIAYDGGLHVFAVSATGQLHQRTYRTGQGWSPRNLGGEFTGTPTVAQWGTSLNVFAISQTHHLYQASTTSGTGTWTFTNHGGIYQGDPAVIAYRGTLQVFAVSTTGNLYQKAYRPGDGWLSEVNFGAPPGGLASSPTAITFDNDGTLQIFAIGTNQRLYQKAYRPGDSWLPIVDFGGTVTGNPTALTYDNTIQIFAVNTNGNLNQKPYRTGQGWLNWANFNGTYHPYT